MILLNWNKDLECGIELIDRQHHQLVELANTFLIRYKCGNKRTAVEQYIAFLKQYVLYHFQAEEAFQVECKYPNYRAHQAMHTALATKVKFFEVQLQESGFDAQSMQQFQMFVIDWMVTHIFVEDIDFAACYRKYAADKKASAS